MLARPALRILVATGLVLAARAAASEPLDVSDPTPRTVFVQVEISPGLATVGQSYGPITTATWSASGGVGTLVIPAESHEALRSSGYQAVPGTFTPYVIHIDLATLAATSEPTSGVVELGEWTSRSRSTRSAPARSADSSGRAWGRCSARRRPSRTPCAPSSASAA